MSRWFRVDDGVVDDPKMQRLSDRLFRAVLNLWCVTSQNGGNLPSIEDIAFKLRSTPAKAQKLVDELREADLIDQDENGSRPHNWNARQFKSDVSTERVKQFRKRRGNVSDTVSETPPETEQKQNRADARARDPTKYVFESGVIRLAEKHFNQWKRAFIHLDLEAELVGATAWAEQQSNWFQAVSSLLAKKNQAAKERKEKPANGAGNPLFEGIT